MFKTVKFSEADLYHLTRKISNNVSNLESKGIQFSSVFKDVINDRVVVEK